MKKSQNTSDLSKGNLGETLHFLQIQLKYPLCSLPIGYLKYRINVRYHLQILGFIWNLRRQHIIHLADFLFVPKQKSITFLPVPSRSSYFLVIIFNRGRGRIMDNKTHIILVYPHPKSIGRNQNKIIPFLPFSLFLVSLPCRKPCMIKIYILQIIFL